MICFRHNFFKVLFISAGLLLIGSCGSQDGGEDQAQQRPPQSDQPQQQQPGPVLPPPEQPQPEQTVSSARTKERVMSDFLGVNAHLLWFSSANYQRQVSLLEDLGLKWLRLDIHWSYLEPEVNQFNVADLDQLMIYLSQRNMQELVYFVGSPRHFSTAPAEAGNFDQYPLIDNAVFVDRLNGLISRYPNVEAWQVWNEPNIPSNWQPLEDPVAYGALVSAVAEGIDTNVTLALGGMSYYSQMPLLGGLMLESLHNQGVLNKVDVVAYHPYTHQPESDGVESHPDSFIEEGNQLNGLLRSAGVEQIWATEFGWSTYTGPVEHQPLIDEATQAEYLVKRISLMMEMDYNRIFLFTLSDLDGRATVRDRSYGLLTEAAEPKPSYTALKNFLNATGNRLEQIDAPINFSSDPDYAFWWQNDAGQKFCIFWNRGAADVPVHADIDPLKRVSLIKPLSGETHSLQASAGTLQFVANKQLQILMLD